jgi:hypothetical protein
MAAYPSWSGSGRPANSIVQRRRSALQNAATFGYNFPSFNNLPIGLESPTMVALRLTR